MSEVSRARDYIFIVGLPRTGTTLLRNVLNGSPEIGLGGEAQFFSDEPRLRFWRRTGARDRFQRVGDMRTTDGAARVVDAIMANQKEDFWGRLARGMGRERLLAELLATDRSDRALLDLAYAFHADGRRYRGEKTPANLYAVPRLVAWFPDARIIHTVRDPRSIFVSQRRKYDVRRLWGPLDRLRRLGVLFDLYFSLRIILAWVHAARLHRSYRRRYGERYYLSRYESLVARPEATVRELCRFLDVPFDDRMLDQVVANSGYVGAGTTAGFDRQAVDRWRTELGPVLRRWFSMWCGRRLIALGYEP